MQGKETIVTKTPKNKAQTSHKIRAVSTTSDRPACTFGCKNGIRKVFNTVGFPPGEGEWVEEDCPH